MLELGMDLMVGDPRGLESEQLGKYCECGGLGKVHCGPSEQQTARDGCAEWRGSGCHGEWRLQQTTFEM